MPKISPCLLFEGRAEEAINFYLSVFEQSEILSLKRYGPNNEAGTEGSIEIATISLHGQAFLCIDSNIQHNFTFTPSISFFVTCDSEQEIDTLFSQLSERGEVLMPLDSYGFSPKFAWVSDRFGVSWQLSLA